MTISWKNFLVGASIGLIVVLLYGMSVGVIPQTIKIGG